VVGVVERPGAAGGNGGLTVRRPWSFVAAAALLVVLPGACAAPTALGAPTPAATIPAGTTTTAPTTAQGPSPATPASPTTPPTPSAKPEADSAAATPAFAATVGPITAALAARMAASWHEGCPVPVSDLRYVTLTHWDMAGRAVTGELVLHKDVADSAVAAFHALFDARFPIASMRLVDDFGGSDDASMAADNTSAFNCRVVAGGTSWSEHAYGLAIDINPVENPEITGGRVLPPSGEPFVDRHEAPGVIRAGDLVVRAFAAHGWRWGGSWTSPVDYQHFSTTGH
jgi:poly-gamma-glutamate synthesis protein (capsule biosynthesis protein)